MKISVVIATYNGSKFIRDQIRSLLDQVVKPDEIVLCDDCSSDNTLSVAIEELRKSNVQFITQKNDTNYGVSKTFERGVLLSSGDIVFFCDQDDIWEKTKIKKTVDALTEFDADFVFTNAYITDSELNVSRSLLWDSVMFKPKAMDNCIEYSPCSLFPELMKRNFVTGMTVACKRSFINECLPFPVYPLHDYWLALNASLFRKIVAVSEPLVYYRQHSNNAIGTNKRKRALHIMELKTAHDKTLQNQLNLYQTAYALCDSDAVKKETKDLAKDFYEFTLQRIKAINRSCFAVLGLRSHYKMFGFLGPRSMKKDLFYSVFLKGKK